MKIKHLLLIPIIGYLIYLMHHAFTVSFYLTKNDIETPFDVFAGIVTCIIIASSLIGIPFIIIYLKENTTIFKRINKFLNHKIL